MLFRVLALAACTVVAWYAVYKYHQRRGVELEQRHAKHHGWEKMTINVRQEVWKCPRCRALIPTWADVNQHQGVESPCGVLEVEQHQLAELESTRAAAKDAESAGRWNVSATVGGEEHRGAVDTFAELEGERRELEGGRDDA